MRLLSFLLPLFLTSCAGFQVELPSAPVGSAGTALQAVDSLHFSVSGTKEPVVRETAELCEKIYQKVMFDTNLLSFKPKENYRIVIHEDRESYRRETGMPAWSGGATITQLAGAYLPSERHARSLTSIHTFEEALSAPLLAHEISHLVFNEYMEFQSLDRSGELRWLNEGLATYEELGWFPPEGQQSLLQSARAVLKERSMPLSEMIPYRPLASQAEIIGYYFEGGRTLALTRTELWYWQVRSVTEFLIRRHGEYGFYQFLKAFKEGRSIEGALQVAYPGRWSRLGDLEREWKESL